MARHPRHIHEGGQVALVLVFLLASLLVLALMNVDVFLAARSKNRLTDAGDAAALAGARWQGLTLNLIGQLNLAHLDIACRYAEDPLLASNLCAGVAALQERIAFAGPLMGCFDANRAARLNGVGEFIETRQLLQEAVARAVNLPSTATWPDKASDYTLMLQAAFSEGASAGVDNAKPLQPRLLRRPSAIQQGVLQRHRRRGLVLVLLPRGIHGEAEELHRLGRPAARYPARRILQPRIPRLRRAPTPGPRISLAARRPGDTA